MKITGLNRIFSTLTERKCHFKIMHLLRETTSMLGIRCQQYTQTLTDLVHFKS